MSDVVDDPEIPAQRTASVRRAVAGIIVAGALALTGIFGGIAQADGPGDPGRDKHMCCAQLPS